MGCCGTTTNKGVKYGDRVIPMKEIQIIEKWTTGAIARRRFKKFVQVKSIACQKKPVYKNGKLIKTDEVLMTDDDVAYQLSHKAGGKGHYWNTRFVDIQKGRKYRGQWTAPTDKKKASQW